MKRLNLNKILGALGLLGIAFYALHIIVGASLYDGYNPVTQAVSDLTAVGAPSRQVASILSALYGCCMLMFFIALYIHARKTQPRLFATGALSLLVMQAVSTVGYSVFPLSNPEAPNAILDGGHIAVTAVVVIASIIGLVLIALASLKTQGRKWLAYVSFATLVLMMTGSFLTGAVPAILGLAERLTIYSLHIYFAVLAVGFIACKNN